MRILVSGGGTGGHLYPGLAIARALVALDARVRPHFVGALRGIERDVLPTTEFPHTLLDLHPLYRRTPWENWKTVRGALSGWRVLAALTRSDVPSAVIGTGGYAAGLALAFGRARGWPTVLHECDSRPGLTTRAFAGKATLVSLGFPEAATTLTVAPSTHVEALGNPIAPPFPVSLEGRARRRAAWGFAPDVTRVVLVVGGSQGARAINEAVRVWATSGLPSGVGVIWATGRGTWDTYSSVRAERLVVRPYLDPITEAYAVADLAVARAGAMTIAELCAWGIPSVLVPLPTAAADHQSHNARTLAAAGAAVHLPQRELDGGALRATVETLLGERDTLARMAMAAIERGRPDAARQIAMRILACVRERAI
ncbi:MAG: UDP-N-acetylglucosamine--N-acetylmuramyl-(pentapeptide) pyrophosphoryl-undecaprenol N-acetylglucosamine transferase [Gemmatimonadaceae bacterium]|jgi:UDP-N-acetylglucosamine--N-acetylmuramyl-(pentapeptide) pyrophosphoryl-undecaprenol N-acetylglucosamine transferase|nr:UDP-N-acetylglucosamine--N-acetylmuramyl-(pentapeptide) pyrophosphoryl-undecaprenol N-acetylglucosamine transferase [Gemmatimonadaceae bacterium]